MATRGGSSRRGAGGGPRRGSGAGLGLDQLGRQLAAGKVARLYLCVGEESWLARAAVQAIESQVITDANREWGKEELSAAEASASDILRAATAAPMLGGRQLIIVRSVDRLRKADKEGFPAALDLVPDSTVLVLTAEKLDGRTTFTRELKRRCVAVSCDPLPEERVHGWIRARFARKDRGCQISREAVERLQLLAGSDLGALDGEIGKLAEFVRYDGGRDRVTVEDVDRVAGGGTGAGLADLVNAIGDRDEVRAHAALATVLESGHHPVEVLAHIGYRLHDLWRAADTGRQPGVWFRREVLDQFRRFRPEELRRAAVMLFEADRRLKSSAGDPRLILESLIRKVTAGEWKHAAPPRGGGGGGAGRSPSGAAAGPVPR